MNSKSLISAGAKIGALVAEGGDERLEICMDRTIEMRGITFIPVMDFSNPNILVVRPISSSVSMKNKGKFQAGALLLNAGEGIEIDGKAYSFEAAESVEIRNEGGKLKCAYCRDSINEDGIFFNEIKCGTISFRNRTFCRKCAEVFKQVKI